LGEGGKPGGHRGVTKRAPKNGLSFGFTTGEVSSNLMKSRKFLQKRGRTAGFNLKVFPLFTAAGRGHPGQNTVGWKPCRLVL